MILVVEGFTTVVRPHDIQNFKLSKPAAYFLKSAALNAWLCWLVVSILVRGNCLHVVD